MTDRTDSASREQRVITAAKGVRAALEDEGNHPHLHWKVMRDHRRQWPALWEALDRLMDETP